MAAKRNRCFLHVDVHRGSWGVHPFEEPGPHTNAPPCQRQRGLKAAGFGSHDHLQAVFLPIHPARLIECPRLSMPAGVTSYHKPPAPLLIKQWTGGSAIKKGKWDRGRDRGANARYFDRRLVKVELLAVSRGSSRRQEFSFNILSWVFCEDKFSLITSPLRPCGGSSGGQRSWSTEVGYKALGPSS